MRTYVSPIGYDTRRVTRPVVNTGLSSGDTVQLLRPEHESDTERASQTIADVKQLLQEIEPEAEFATKKVTTNSFEQTVQDCCGIFAKIPEGNETIVSLGGGARDILLPLTVSSIVFGKQIDRTLFFSDLDNEIQEWSLPRLAAQVPERTLGSFEVIASAEGWISLSSIADRTSQSKSTVIRHVNDLEDAGVLESDTSNKTKRVRIAFSGELFQLAQSLEA
jgi:CRISPR-associated protein Csa3